MSQFSNSLPFNSISEITFSCEANAVKIYVGTELLGAVNPSFPVTVYITVSGGNKGITMKQISDADYLAGNTNDYEKDTIAFNYLSGKTNLHIGECPGSGGCTYKTIGWNEDSVGQVSVNNTAYFNITVNGNFKAKIEAASIRGTIQQRMVVRYSGNINEEQTSSAALCCTSLFCYVC